MIWPFRRQEPQGSRADQVSAAAHRDDDLSVVQAIAAAHLADDVRERWLQLLRPAVQLVPAAALAGQPVARLGGLPSVPLPFTWPVWDGCGPLSYIGELDLSAVASFDTGPLNLPTSGRVLFFYFDGSYGDGADIVGFWDPETMAGVRAFFVPSEVQTTICSAPEGIAVYTEQSFAGRQIYTAPDWDHPDLQAAFQEPGADLRTFADHPVCSDDFQGALHERRRGPRHQIGGYADCVQGPVEGEVAETRLRGTPHEDPAHALEAGRWELLFQVDTDSDLGMTWGDAGTLYWLAQPVDLARGDLTDIAFTWQCG